MRRRRSIECGSLGAAGKSCDEGVSARYGRIWVVPSPTVALLPLTAEEASRRIAIDLVRAATAAAARVAGRADPEALHDLRVALRRLRSIVRALKEPLAGSLSKRRRTRLKELASSTGEARDAEVQLAWAAGMLDGSLEPQERVAVTFLHDQWAARRDAAFARIDAEVLPGLDALLPRLERDLSTYTTEHTTFAPRQAATTLGNILAELAQDEVASLVHGLRSVTTMDDQAVAHEARIHGKRLRYLLEPFRAERTDVDDAVQTLRTLQDVLGDLNDRTVRTAEMTRALESLATSHVRDLAREAQGEWSPVSERMLEDGVQPGLLSLLRHEGAHKTRSFDALVRGWVRGPGLTELEASVRAAIRRA